MKSCLRFETIPGPWQVGMNGSVVANHADLPAELDEASQAFYGGRQFICESVVGDRARLIAAAPELLAALEAADQFIKNGIEFGYVSMPDPGCPDSALKTPDLIQAAIAKARGEA